MEEIMDQEDQADLPEPGEAAEQEAPAQRQALPQSEMIDRITAAAIKALYAKPEIVQGIIKMIAGAKRPEIGIARAAFSILEQIKEKMRGADPRLAVAAAPELIAEIVRIAVKAGVIKKDRGIVERASQILMQELRRPPAQPTSQQQPQPEPAAGAMPAEQGMEQPPGAMGGGGMISEAMGG